MDYELSKIKAQVSVLKDVLKTYPTCTISNAITQLEARIKEINSRNIE